jgi:hypothetical protein
VRVLGSILMGLMLVGAEPVLGQSVNQDSENFFLPYCRNFMAVADGTGSLPTKSTDLISEGQCMGVVSAMIAAGPLLGPENRSCPPQGVNIGQGARVVTRFLDTSPNLLHYDFRLLVIMAFQSAWPCKS